MSESFNVYFTGTQGKLHVILCKSHSIENKQASTTCPATDKRVYRIIVMWFYNI